jgi:hypothetical protein
VSTTEEAAPKTLRPTTRLPWWREALYILAFYAVYTAVRNTQGSASVSAEHARTNAHRLIGVERFLHIFQEHRIQHAFLGNRLFVQFWDVFYGTAHFIVTAVALIVMFRTMKGRYPLWRNTLACTTALALIGFATFPLMPPRLLHEYGFVDTLQRYGGLWSFDSGAMQKISNQYAAMPSLHFAWSSWSALVLLPRLKRPWAKALMIAYPFITLFCIVVTANHYILDAAGGALVLTVGFLIGRAITVFNNARLERTEAA